MDVRGVQDTHPAVAPAAVEGRLRTEPIAWLTTVRPDGAPHIVPVWFLWDGEDFIVFSKPSARKVHNIADEARVMLAVGKPEDDFDVQLVEGDATLIGVATTELGVRIAAKYREWMDAVGLSVDDYVATYSQVIRVRPTRFLPWRGRTGGGRLETLRERGRAAGSWATRLLEPRPAGRPQWSIAPSA